MVMLGIIHIAILCVTKFISTNQIKRHMKSHVRENPYNFVLCGKGFISWSHLRRHMKSHDGEKPYQELPNETHESHTVLFVAKDSYP